MHSLRDPRLTGCYPCCVPFQSKSRVQFSFGNPFCLIQYRSIFRWLNSADWLSTTSAGIDDAQLQMSEIIEDGTQLIQQCVKMHVSTDNSFVCGITSTQTSVTGLKLTAWAHTYAFAPHGQRMIVVRDPKIDLYGSFYLYIVTF